GPDVGWVRAATGPVRVKVVEFFDVGGGDDGPERLVGRSRRGFRTPAFRGLEHAVGNQEGDLVAVAQLPARVVGGGANALGGRDDGAGRHPWAGAFDRVQGAVVSGLTGRVRRVGRPGRHGRGRGRLTGRRRRRPGRGGRVGEAAAGQRHRQQHGQERTGPHGAAAQQAAHGPPYGSSVSPPQPI